MKHLLFRMMLIPAIICAFLTAAAAETGRLNLVMIGGDGDLETGNNNIFRNILFQHEDLQDDAEAFFVRSVKGDYTNATAIQRKELAAQCLSADGVNVIAGFSHGGQSVYFLETDNISDIFLMDACVSIGGKCSNPDSCGKVWAEWIIDTAKKGVNLHVFASKGKHDEPSGTKNAIRYLEEIATEDAAVVNLEDGWYRTSCENGGKTALIETAVLEGTHKDICITVEERVAQYLYTLLGKPGEQQTGQAESANSPGSR